MSGFDNEVVYANNVDFSGSPTVSARMLTDGQLLIASTAPNAGGTHVNVGVLSLLNTTLSPSFVTPNLQINFALSNLLLGANGSAITTGGNNVALGALSGGSIQQAVNTVAIGSGALPALISGGGNIAVGTQALQFLTTGSSNIAIGFAAGSFYAANEGNNLLIYNVGTLGDNHTIRIGTQGSSSGQQNACFIAGIQPVTVTGNLVNIASTGQLGSIAAGTTGQVLTGVTGASPVFATLGGGVTWSVITGASQAMTSNNGYIANRASNIAFSLPTTSAVGDVIEVTGINTALGWTVSWTTNQQVFFGNATTTVTTGSLSSSATRDSIRMVCVVANLTWNVIASVGNITCV